MKMCELLDNLEPAKGNLDVQGLSIDSRTIHPGECFLAIKGNVFDGHDYAKAAVARGAACVVSEQPLTLSVPNFVEPALSNILSEMGSRYYDNPSHQIRCIGVTGTNGKTSICHHIAALFKGLNQQAAFMGTIGWGVPGFLCGQRLTTEDPLTVQRRLRRLVDEDYSWVAMEVSSHALAQRRTEGVEFDTAIFSNISRDHLDFHKNMASYVAAKKRLFVPELKLAVINLDDEYASELIAATHNNTKVLTYGRNPEADVTWSKLKFHSHGVSGEFSTPWGESAFSVPLFGEFSVANLAAAITSLAAQGFSLSQLLTAAQELPQVPGRAHFIRSEGQPCVVVDYAHTPDALEKILQAMRVHTTGRIICVFGCGGNRDEGKRPQMGAIASANADEVWVTSDNPRFEEPENILDQIISGIPNNATWHREADRATALRQAIAGANNDDIVVVTGKGHEDYQEIKGKRLSFSDLQVVEAIFAERGAR